VKGARRLSRRDLMAIGAAGVVGSLLKTQVGKAHAVAGPSPIEHAVVILRENHSYDNYFGKFPGGDGKTAGRRCADETPDPPHLREHALRGSSFDGRGYCHYLEDDVPNYWKYAREFVLCDNYFADARASSYPNYFMMMAAQTPTLDHIRGDTRGKYDLPTIADRLTGKGIAWRNYNDGIPLVAMFKRAWESGNVVPLSQFGSDAATGQLPAVTWLTPSLRDSEHPPASVKQGENWTVRQINALMDSPQWSKCAVFVVWDESGGFWDHVDPPVVEKEKGFLGLGPAIRYGYRIPCLVIGPYAKRGYVSRTLYSHASLLKTIERLFDVPPLTDRDAQANDLLDCFDFDQTPRAPVRLAERGA
jgi:phospholipase C